MAPEVRVLQAGGADDVGPDEVAVVVDVLRATTTACVLLHRGARRVFPVESAEEAHALARRLADPLMVGERDRGSLPGFIDNSPARLLREEVRGRDVVFTTTNGTAVLLACRHASTLAAGGLVNAGALAEALDEVPSVAVVAAGWKGDPAEDDNAAAAYIADLIRGNGADRTAAVAGVMQSLSARRLNENGKSADVDVAIQFDAYPVVPVFQEGALVDYNYLDSLN